MLAWLSVWSEVQTFIWPCGFHCHSLFLASVKSRLVLPFWYRLTRVVPDKGPLNVCVCVCVCVRLRPSNQVGPNLFACVMHSLSSAGGAALANVVRNTSCGMEVDFAHKIGCHGNVSWGIEKVTSDRLSTANVPPIMQISWRSVNVEIIGLVEIAQNVIKK